MAIPVITPVANWCESITGRIITYLKGKKLPEIRAKGYRT